MGVVVRRYNIDILTIMYNAQIVQRVGVFPRICNSAQ